MSYAIIMPKTPFMANEVKVRGSYLEKNKLWKVNEGEFLLHFGGGEADFRREIGLDTFHERVQFLNLTDEGFSLIVQHFFQKGELRSITYHEMDEDLQSEFRYLSYQLQEGVAKDEATTLAFMQDYTHFVEDYAGKPWYITLYQDKQQVKLYHNGVLYPSSHDPLKTESIVFDLYAEIFALLGMPFRLSAVLISEKETTEHPLKNAHAYVTELLKHSGEKAQAKLNLSEEEAKLMNEHLLNYAKEFENKRIYIK